MADWIKAYSAQKSEAAKRFGVVSSSSGTVPHVPGSLAKALWSYWDNATTKVGEILEEGGGKSDSYLQQENAKAAAARTQMIIAIKTGVIAPSYNSEGLACLSAPEAWLVWNGAQKLATIYQSLSADTSIPWSESWDAIKAGAHEGLGNVGEFAGGIAAGVGEGAGSLLGGFFKGFGIVNLAVIGGGIYLATKVV